MGFVKYSLEDEVAKFIKWYKNNLYDDNYPEKYRSPKEVINFIEKMAVWYELRYPEYEINKILIGSNQEIKDVTEEMFYKNETTKSILNSSNNKTDLNFSDFYNKEAFINSLPVEESFMLCEPSFPVLIYLDSRCHIHFNEDGTIDETDGIGLITQHRFNDTEFIGKSAYNLEFILRKINVLPKKNKLSKTIEKYEKEKKFKEGLLNCVMYRIIDRGGNRIGPRRGLLFAKEFNANIDIPMICGIDYSDPGLFKFIKEYLDAGGKKDLVCLEGYGINKRLKQVSLKEIIDEEYTKYILLGNPPDEVISQEQRELNEIIEELAKNKSLTKIK